MAQKKKEETSKVKREFSAGGVVYKRTKNKKVNDITLWLITRSKPSKDYPISTWRLPKGWLDDRNGGKVPGPLASGEKRADKKLIQNAAAREVKEEGGIEARVVKKITTEKYFYSSKLGQKILKFVTFYLMEYQKDCEEGFGFETAETVWLDYERARKKLTHGGEKVVLDKAREFLEKD